MNDNTEETWHHGQAHHHHHRRRRHHLQQYSVGAILQDVIHTVDTERDKETAIDVVIVVAASPYEEEEEEAADAWRLAQADCDNSALKQLLLKADERTQRIQSIKCDVLRGMFKETEKKDNIENPLRIQPDEATTLMVIVKCPFATKEDIATYIARYACSGIRTGCGPYGHIVVLTELSNYAYDSLHRNREENSSRSTRGTPNAVKSSTGSPDDDQEQQHVSLTFLQYLENSIPKRMHRALQRMGYFMTVGVTVEARTVWMPQICIAGSGPSWEIQEPRSDHPLLCPSHSYVFAHSPPRHLTYISLEEQGQRNPSDIGQGCSSLYNVDPSVLPPRSVQEMKHAAHLLLSELRRRKLDISSKGACFGLGRISTWIGNCVMQQVVEDPVFGINEANEKNADHPAALILVDRSLDLTAPLLTSTTKPSRSNKNPISANNLSDNLLHQVFSYWERAQYRLNCMKIPERKLHLHSSGVNAWIPVPFQGNQTDSTRAMPVPTSIFHEWDQSMYGGLTGGKEQTVPPALAKHIVFHLFRTYWSLGPTLFTCQDSLYCRFRQLIALHSADSAYDHLMQLLLEIVGGDALMAETEIHIFMSDRNTWHVTLDKQDQTKSGFAKICVLQLDSIVYAACPSNFTQSNKLGKVLKLWLDLVSSQQQKRIRYSDMISFILSILIGQLDLPVWKYIQSPTSNTAVIEARDMYSTVPSLLQPEDQLAQTDEKYFFLTPWLVVLDVLSQYMQMRHEQIFSQANVSIPQESSLADILRNVVVVASTHGDAVALEDQEQHRTEEKTIEGHTFFVLCTMLATSLMLADAVEVTEWFPSAAEELEQLECSFQAAQVKAMIDHCSKLKENLCSESRWHLLAVEPMEANDGEGIADDWDESWSQWSEEETDDHHCNPPSNSTEFNQQLLRAKLTETCTRPWLRKIIEVCFMRRHAWDFSQEESDHHSSPKDSPLTNFSSLTGLMFSINSLHEPYSPLLSRLVDVLLNNRSNDVQELVQLGSKTQQLSRATAKAAYATIGAAESLVKRGVGALSTTFGDAFSSSILGSTVGSMKQKMTSWKSNPGDFDTIVIFVSGGISGVDLASLEALRQNAEAKYFHERKNVIILSSHICSQRSILHSVAG